MQELKSGKMSVNEPKYTQSSFNKPKGAWLTVNEMK